MEKQPEAVFIWEVELVLKLNRFKGDKAAKAQLKVAQTKKKVQDWLPFQDIDSGKLMTKDGRTIALSRVQPINMLLKSDRETERVVQIAHEAINGLRDAIQILCVQRPVDLEAYLSSLAEQAKGITDYRKKMMLANYIRYVSSLASSGEAKEKRFFVLTSAEGRNAKGDVASRMDELVAGLGRGELGVNVIDDGELLDLLFTYHNPAQAAFETIDGDSYGNFTQYKGEA